MNRLVAAPSLLALALIVSPAAAQAPPEPLPLPASTKAPPESLPMGVPYIYQYGNPNWYRPVAYGPAPLYGYPSYYPFGANGPVYGRYSWDYSAYYAAGMGWYTENLPSYPYPIRYSGALYLQYPTYSYNHAWKGFGW